MGTWVSLVLTAQRQSALLWGGPGLTVAHFGPAWDLALLLPVLLLLEHIHTKAKRISNVGPSRWTCPLRRAHLEERKALGLVEDQVLVNEGALGGHALVACAQLVLQGALNAARDQSALTRGGRLHLLPSMSSWTRLWQCQISLCAHSCVSEACNKAVNKYITPPPRTKEWVKTDNLHKERKTF